jgi:uncharacterized repeat protein (TIGR03943 family)
VVLVGLGLVAVVGPGHDRHGHPPYGPRVAWLLALPPLALVLIAPPALGTFAASRQPIRPPPVIHPGPSGPTGPAAAGSDLFPPLIPPRDGTAVPMALGEYLARDYQEPYTLAGVRIRLVGFVTPQHGGRDGYLLTRFAISCCAADATALRVAIRGDRVVRAPDSWLEVEGRWQQRTGDHADQPASDTPRSFWPSPSEPSRRRPNPMSVGCPSDDIYLRCSASTRPSGMAGQLGHAVPNTVGGALPGRAGAQVPLRLWTIVAVLWRTILR